MIQREQIFYKKKILFLNLSYRGLKNNAVNPLWNSLNGKIDNSFHGTFLILQRDTVVQILLI